MKVSLALHLVGLVMWVGSLLILTRCLKIFGQSFPSEAAQGVDAFRPTIKRIFFGFCLPGALISLGTGLYQISQMGMSYYMKQGWFHGKLTLVIVLLVVTVFLAKQVKKVANREIVSPKMAIALHAVSASSMVLIIFLTILFR